MIFQIKNLISKKSMYILLNLCYNIFEVFIMTEKQKTHLDEVIFSMEVEGFEIPDEEKETLIDILNGRYTFQEILDSYISEAKAYGRV